MDKTPEKIDSKFRFILVAACRAEQLIHGARPHLEGEVKKPTSVAQEEIQREMVEWRYGPPPAPPEEEAAEEAVAETSEAEEEVH